MEITAFGMSLSIAWNDLRLEVHSKASYKYVIISIRWPKMVSVKHLKLNLMIGDSAQDHADLKTN